MRCTMGRGVLGIGLFLAWGCGSSAPDEPSDGDHSGGAASGGQLGSGGGASSTGGGSSNGGSPADPSGTGGALAAGGTLAAGGSPSSSACSGAAWPAADPSGAGPFSVVTEEEVGPLAGEGEDGAPVPFTLFRPEVLGQEGRCHPIITWGNGTGSTPNLYGVLLRHLASHGFLVIASNSPNVTSGDPPPMVVGAQWLIEQNTDPQSPLFGKVDPAHVGATGHSQGGFATSTAGADPVITTIAPLCGAGRPMNLGGPAFFMCGGLDEVVSCDGIETAFSSVQDVPAMFANFLMGDHADWLSFGGTGTVKPVEAVVTAWMRVHLMGDAALRGMFYGDACGLCEDEAWQVARSGME